LSARRLWNSPQRKTNRFDSNACQSTVQLDNVAVGHDVAGSDLLTFESGRAPHASMLEGARDPCGRGVQHPRPSAHDAACTAGSDLQVCQALWYRRARYPSDRRATRRLHLARARCLRRRQAPDTEGPRAPAACAARIPHPQLHLLCWRATACVETKRTDRHPPHRHFPRAGLPSARPASRRARASCRARSRSRPRSRDRRDPRPASMHLPSAVRSRATASDAQAKRRAGRRAESARLRTASFPAPGIGS